LVEFARAPEEPVEVLVNGRVVARGELVMVQGNYGVRIGEISSRGERLDTGGQASPETGEAL
jgi:flagellar motor switch protein FliN/FliY